MDNRYITMPLQMWQAGFKMWSAAFDMQMSAMNALLPKAREMAEEGAELRHALGEGPEIFVFSGHMPGDADLLSGHGLIPMLNSIEQMTRQFEALPGQPFGGSLIPG